MNIFLDSFLTREFYGEPAANYLKFAGIIIGTLLLKKPIASIVTRLTSSFTTAFNYQQHKIKIKSLLLKPIERILVIILFFVAFNQISELLDNVEVYHSISKKGKLIIKLGDIVEDAFLFFFIVALTKVITHIIDFIYYVNFDKATEEKNQSQLQLLPLIRELSKLVVWLLCIFWILGGVFHVNVPALITGLGIGGVAIALAGKETIENFFAAFTILTDKPFMVGDTIKLGDLEGITERIGFRSTRIRGADGVSIIIPNQKLVGQNLLNYSNRLLQGVKVVFNIRYGITQEKLNFIISSLKQMLNTNELIKHPIEISVETFNAETLKLVVNYFLPNHLPPDTDLVTIKNEICLNMLEIVSQNATLGSPQYIHPEIK